MIRKQKAYVGKLRLKLLLERIDERHTNDDDELVRCGRHRDSSRQSRLEAQPKRPHYPLVSNAPHGLKFTLCTCEDAWNGMRVRYPPIWDIPRPVSTSPSATPWPHGLRQMPPRINRSSSASLAPARIMSRISSSSLRSRQSRSLPSAASRTRLQVEQNGAEMGDINPISPAEPGIFQTTAGSPGLAEIGIKGPNRSSRSAFVSSLVTSDSS